MSVRAEAVWELATLIIRNLVLVLVVVFWLVPGAPSPRTPGLAEADLHPGLSSQEGDILSVIVTAGDSLAAARAVERVGGRITDELRLIDAVVATVSASQLAVLNASPDVRHVQNNELASVAEGLDTEWERHRPIENPAGA